MKSSVDLTKEEIDRVRLKWHHMSHISVLGHVLDLEFLHPYFEALRNHDVFEIGPGYNPVTSHYPCRTYQAADVKHDNDGLSVLRTKSDSSLVVVSFGVFDDDVLGGRHDEMCERYGQALGREIKRVMSPFAIIIGRDARKYIGKADVRFVGLGGVYFRK